ncbi:guanine nucleotide exchange factor for Rab-3A-like [Planococcus citri]|uniref:guanine nucleotide exchange factor for Rab-3A-like n=1 Tax=Planococcus citri TaxID=170843 RepID=UPI0031F8D8CA
MVYNGPIIDKCDVNNINGYDVTYMNKLNETLQVDGDLKFNLSKDDDDVTVASKLNGDVSDNETSADTQNAIYTQEQQITQPKDLSNRTTSDDSGLESAASSWDKSVTEVKEHAFTKLEEELQHAREILRLRDEEVMKLSRIRQDVETELQELTASLFQEAHRMVREANIKQSAAEKALKESTMKVDVLTAEVAALKTLVLTSTPSKPNLHLHGQLSPKTKEDNSLASNGGSSFFKKNHQRSPSHFDLKYGRDSSPSQLSLEDINHTLQSDPLEVKDGYEMDPNVHREFLMWKENPTLEKDNPFITRVYREDIDQSLDFNNSSLAGEVKKAIHLENIFIEAVDKSKCHFPKKCALMEMPRLCYYRMKISDSDEWHCISQICRNRIISVCNFLNYLRYIQRGLVKSSAEDMYWEIIRYRKEMTFARLGLPASPSSY